MTARWALLGLFGLVAAGCQSPPEPFRPLPPPDPYLLHRLRVDQSNGSEDRSPVSILGGGEETASKAEQAEDPGNGSDSEVPSPLGNELQLDHVLRSVESNFPLILAALEEVEIAAGQVQSASGAFDTKLFSKNFFELDGFYQTEEFGFGVEQPTTLYGTRFEAGYRLGQGDFADYDGKKKTNEGGEFRLGAMLPLLRGGTIDPQRVAVWQARLQEEAAWPKVLKARLSATQKAAASYWKWVAEGAKRGIAERLLRLARERQEQVRVGVEEGQLAELSLVENRRLIVDREAILAKADRALQEAALTLSLFWRDEAGQPIVAGIPSLPEQFPKPRDPEEILIPNDVQVALTHRPELRAIEVALSQVGLDRDLARNERLAQLDVGVFGSQDVGNEVNDPDDKGPFEVALGVQFQLPLQRRKARGKERQALAKIDKLEFELRYARDLAVAEVRDVVSALNQSWVRVTQAEENVQLAGRLEEAERVQLSLGESDLFRVNVREQQAAVAGSRLIEVLSEYFRSLTDYRAALGLPYDEVLSPDSPLNRR